MGEIFLFCKLSNFFFFNEGAELTISTLIRAPFISVNNVLTALLVISTPFLTEKFVLGSFGHASYTVRVFLMDLRICPKAKLIRIQLNAFMTAQSNTKSNYVIYKFQSKEN